MKRAAMWAHRRLRGRLDRYADVRDEPSLLDQYPAIRDLVGRYDNPVGGPPSFLISERGLHILSEPMVHIPFAELAAVVYDPDKSQARALELVARDGPRIQLGVAGGEGRFRDSYPVGTFISRLIPGGFGDRGNGSRA